ncbi:MAG: helicase-exonuclease AddAB subunit AddA [Bacillota bacterium]
MRQQWSEKQREAIESRGTNLLLSAAAGSGKTSVLVGRITALVQEGADIQNMLVVTFTNAAVADMRERIVAYLAACAENAAGEERQRLHRQAALAERADISTIHAFCLSVLRRHFQAVGLDPAFRTGNEAETSVIKAEAIDALFEEKYQAQDEGFLLLLEAFGRKDDTALKECVLALHRKMSALTDLGAFREQALMQYAAKTPGSLYVVRQMLRGIKERMAGSLFLMQKAAEMCGGDFPKTHAHLMLEAEEIEKLIAAAGTSFEEFVRAVKSYAVPGLPPEKREPQFRREQALALRDTAKDQIKALLREECFFDDGPAVLEDFLLCHSQLSSLFSLIDAFDAVFSEMKRARNIIDYADMERLAYSVLQDDAVAEEYRTRYDYVFIDEYQDTSFLQEAVISRICREDNLFAVGDVKQSIYRFRMAQPELFMRRYEAYEKGAGGRRIDLVQNFRSSRAVVETVNAVFGPVMTRGAGGVDYGESERLSGTRGDSGCCELIVCDKGAAYDALEQEDGAEQLPALEREAHIAAAKLMELRKTGAYRWRDMVVLMRSVQVSAQVYAQVFSKAGIPCYADAAEAHIETVEVELFINLLRLIDNPLQDLPLLSVLFGPVCGLSAEQLLSVRDAFPDAPFYEAARAYAEKKDDAAANALSEFFVKLERWTFEASMRTVDELVDALLAETGMHDIVSALPGGVVRRKNLEILLGHAQDFAKTGQGLSGFLGFLDYVRASGDKGDSARALGENDDVVRIMTVHKSKGLEFPVVVFAGMGKRFNPRDRAEDVVFHDRLGLGIRTFDAALRTRRNNVVRTAILHALSEESLSEEMRILYVGMTRARDILIMTGSVSSLEKRLLTLGQPGGAGVFSASCPLDFVLCALQRRDALGAFRARPGETLSIPVGQTALQVQGGQTTVAETVRDDAAPVWQEAMQDTPDADTCARVQAAMEFYRLEPPVHIPAKIPVSRLHPVRQDGIQPPGITVRAQRNAAGTPSQAAEQGTAMHIALQHMNLHAALNEKSVLDQLKSMVMLGLLTKEQADIIDAGALFAFASSSLGRRMANARTVRREWPFTLQMGAGEVMEGAPAGDTLLVQGVMDACFEEDGAWVLIDFKTDRVEEQTLELSAEKHAVQLDFYARALETLTSMPVKERWVYLLRANRGVRLEDICA